MTITPGTDTVGICQALTGCVNALGHHNRLCPASPGTDTSGQALAEAWAALPEPVADDAAPEGTSLADRIKALGLMLDEARTGWSRCHERHMAVERGDTSGQAVQRVLDLADEMETGPLLVRGDSTAARIRAVAGPQRDHDEETALERQARIASQRLAQIPEAYR